MVIFIVDDSKYIRQSLKSIILEIPGISVIGETGKKSEVLFLVKKQKPDCVILDLRLDTGNAFDLIQEIKKIDPKIQIAIFSSHSYPLYKKKCSELGADYYFEKSKNPEKLISLIEQIAQKKSQKSSSQSQVRAKKLKGVNDNKYPK